MRLTDELSLLRIKNMLGRLRNRYLVVADLILLPMAALMAFLLRLDSVQLQIYIRAMVIYALAAPLIQIPIFAALGVYSQFWQYAGADEMLLLAWAALIGGLAQGAIFLGGRVLFPGGPIPLIPRSIPLIAILLTLVCIAGTRFALREISRSAKRATKLGKSGAETLQHVLIAGAGEAGALVLRELRANPQTGLVPIGFVDDDPAKQGMLINRMRVLGGREAIPDLVRQKHVEQVIIAMPGAAGKVIRGIVATCEAAGAQAKIVPAISDLLDGGVSISQIRDVDIEDLLRREPVRTDTAQVAALLRGRRVLVTGAGGSIGSELCRQIARCNPAEIILLGHGENSIFEISNELSGWGRDAGLSRAGARTGEGESLRLITHPVIADIRFADRIRAVLEEFRPEVIFHAAAHKHVPLMEQNPSEAISNNVLGTRNLLDAAAAIGVQHFVMISTDKAVNPSNIMGAAKRVAELLVYQTAQRTGRPYVAVRFGNVLGSRGSVVLTFKQQIAAGGPVTVTHPDVCRYFMTIPEAVQLVLQAAAMGKGGEVFVLDMGEPVRVYDLAQDLIRLSGLEPGRDIDIQFIGLRPGDKLFEELFLTGEAYRKTQHEKIFVANNGYEETHPEAGLDEAIDRLAAAAARNNRSAIVAGLRQLVPEFEPLDTPAAVPANQIPSDAEAKPEGWVSPATG